MSNIRIRICAALAPLACLTALAGHATPAQAAEEPCKARAVPPAFQQVGVAPAGVVTVGTSVILLDDAGTEPRIMACEIDDKGVFKLRKSWPLPADFTIKTITLQGDRLLLESIEGAEYQQDVGLANDVAAEAAQPKDAPTADGFAFTAEKTSENQSRLRVPLGDAGAPNNAALEFELKPIMPGAEIFTRKVLGRDAAAGTATVYWEEVGEEKTRAFIVRVDRAGAVIAGAEVPLADIETAPERFAGVLSDGRAYYLEVKGAESTPVLLPLEPDFAARARDGTLKDDGKAGKHGRDAGASPESAVSTPAYSGAEPSGEDFEEKVRKNFEEDTVLEESATQTVSRASVIDCAKKYSTFEWTMTAGAYERQGVQEVCSPQAKFRRRPFYLKDTIGKKVVSVPYCWGCSDSIERFAAKVADGSRLAGHSCTCREGHYCLRNDSVGVDCSGFVSQCWKSAYKTTSLMHEIADPISKTSLKAGDALNLPRSHIRLFVEFVPTPSGDKKFRVIEATNGEGAIGRVIEATYSAGSMSSYKAIRYRKIAD